MIFLAIDGVPMNAKLDKQRKKRFERMQNQGNNARLVKQYVQNNLIFQFL
jgi:5'-3' exonuclease